MMKYKEITILLDMAGCPNRCKHCWLGATPNGRMPISELYDAVRQFRPFTDCLQVYDWYREPDYQDQYRELYELCDRLSDKPREHFELASFWRIVRDAEYAKWLASIGVRKVQLTIFGTEETTDFYIGRKGAYRELLRAIDILLENQISPRIQTFVNQQNIDELPHIEWLIEQLDLENRCRSFGGEFSFFLHQGSCDGENEKLYDVRVTPDDLQKIPAVLKRYTLKHFGEKNIEDVFGKTEQQLYEELMTDRSVFSYVNEKPVFHIDKDFNVYPNVSTPTSAWCLGNIKTDGAEKVLERYRKSSSLAQHTRLTVPVCDLVNAQGNRTSQRLFDIQDYIEFLLNRYCRQHNQL